MSYIYLDGILYKLYSLLVSGLRETCSLIPGVCGVWISLSAHSPLMELLTEIIQVNVSRNMVGWPADGGTGR